MSSIHRVHNNRGKPPKIKIIKLDGILYTYVHAGMVANNWLKDLNGHVIERDEIDNTFVLSCFNNNGVNNPRPWHQLMGQLGLVVFNENMVLFHLLLVERKHIGNVLALHDSWITDNGDIFYRNKLFLLDKCLQILALCKSTEADLYIFNGVEGSVVVHSLCKRKWERVSRSKSGLPGVF